MNSKENTNKLYNCFIGIDPGVNGGIAVINGPETKVFNIPKEPKDLMRILFPYLPLNPVVMLEQVGGRFGDGASRAFNFGKNYGMLTTILKIMGFCTVYVTPTVWMKAYSQFIGTSKDYASKTEWKNALKNHAKALYPDVKLTLKTSDALLIAHYAANNYEKICSEQHDNINW